MKKIFKIISILLCCFMFLFASTGCANAASDGGSCSGGSVSVPASFYTPIENLLEASKDFATKSIKANVPSRSALNPSNDDKWEGRIKYQYGNWNVPSYFYGINPGQQLVVNGEDLGTLQNLYHVKDKNNNYRKASFVYKDKVYYVFDKGDYVKGENWVVLSSSDDINHIIFDQKDKTNTPEFSNFKFWVWERDLANICFRTGDLGYAYTLRNVQMLDGSYATVTVACYNYYNYGFRVWIKETDGNSVKNEYPNNAPYNFTSSYVVKNFTPVASGEDFIYEVVNNTTVTLTVRNYIRESSIWDWDAAIIANAQEVQIAAGETAQLKYKLADLIALCPFQSNSIYLGCRFSYSIGGRNFNPGGWENNLNQTGKKHTVTVTLSDEGYMNGENSWSDL